MRSPAPARPSTSTSALSKARLVRTLRALVERAGFDGARARVVFPAALERIHQNNRRRYAQMSAGLMRFEFARSVLVLPWSHQLGLIAHEVGHLIAIRRFGDTSEKGADAASKTVLGITIGYDHSMPGTTCPGCRGLQYARTGKA